MPSQTPVWLGSTAITETPDSPQYGHDATRFYVSRFYEGPYDACIANAPLQGNAFIDFPAGVIIVDVQIKRKPGGIARIEVKAESQISDTDPTAPTYEVEWVEIDRAIEQHPIFADGSNYGASAGAYALTLGDRAAVQAWENEDDFTLKCQWQFKIPQNSTTSPPDGYTALTGSGYPVQIPSNSGTYYNVFQLSTNATVLAKKKFRGQDSYRIWCPVARQTLETFTLPGVNPCGVIENPPAEIGAPTGYAYQRSAQRATKTGRYGKWQQQQEWQGFDSVDTDLYPGA